MRWFGRPICRLKRVSSVAIQWYRRGSSVTWLFLTCRNTYDTVRIDAVDSGGSLAADLPANEEQLVSCWYQCHLVPDAVSGYQSQLVRFSNTPSMSPMTSSILSESSPARPRGSKRNGMTLYLFGLKILCFKSPKVMLARTVTPAGVGNAKKAICDHFRRLLLSVFLFEGAISSPAAPPFL